MFLPPSLDEMIASNHPVGGVNRVVDQIDIRPLIRAYKGRGCSSYQPQMLLKVLIYAYLRNIYSSRQMEDSLTVLLRVIIQLHRIKGPKLLEDVFVYLVNNASNLVSIVNIVNYFKSNGRKTTYDTVANYISYIEDTFMIHKVEHYDIRGKEIISGTCKYYINDLPFKNYRYSGFGYGVGYKLENLVYLELRRAGFEVYVGAMRNKEADFVAKEVDRLIYLQSTYLLVDEQTLVREYAPLEAIGDNYEKAVVLNIFSLSIYQCNYIVNH